MGTMESTMNDCRRAMNWGTLKLTVVYTRNSLLPSNVFRDVRTHGWLFWIGMTGTVVAGISGIFESDWLALLTGICS